MSATSIPQDVRDTIIAELGEGTRIDDVSNDQRAPTELVKRNSPSYLNKLTPPPGTDFWRHQAFSVMTNQELRWTFTGVDILLQTLTWNIDAYVYAVNAQPGDRFSDEGGFVYIVLVHSGSAATGAATGAGTEYRYNVTMVSPPTGAVAFRQLPPSNSGIINGDNTNYRISFAQDMQMFRNGGNELFTFPAQYEDSVDLRKSSQIGFVNGNLGTQWGVITDETPPTYYNFPFSSVSVFRVPSLSEVTFECEASVAENRRGLESRSITVDCRF